jgi:hypothetical protein
MESLKFGPVLYEGRKKRPNGFLTKNIQ